MQDILDDIKALSERERAEDFEWHLFELEYLRSRIQNARPEEANDLRAHVDLKIDVGAAYLALGYGARIFEGATKLLSLIRSC